MNGGSFDAHGDAGPLGFGPTNGGRPDAHAGGDPRMPDHLIDDILDGAMPREKIRNALDALRRDRDRADDLDWTADALEALRADATAPDLSEIILARTGMSRSWLSSVMRRRMLIGRVAGVAAVLAMIAGAFLLQRVSPTTFDDSPTPIAGLVRAVPSDAAQAAGAVRLPGAEQMTIAIFALDEGHAFFLEDDADIWAEHAQALTALRQWWSPRQQQGNPEPGIRVLDAGYSGGMRVLTPMIPDEDHEPSAAIVISPR